MARDSFWNVGDGDATIEVFEIEPTELAFEVDDRGPWRRAGVDPDADDRVGSGAGRTAAVAGSVLAVLVVAIVGVWWTRSRPASRDLEPALAALAEATTVRYRATQAEFLGVDVDVTVDDSSERVRYLVQSPQQEFVGFIDVAHDVVFVSNEASDPDDPGESGAAVDGADEQFVPIEVEFEDLTDAMRQFVGDPRRLGELVELAEPPGVEVVGDDRIDDVDARHFRLRVEAGAVVEVLGAGFAIRGFASEDDGEQHIFVVDLWVADGDRLVQAKVDCDCAAPRIALVYEIGEADEPVLIVLPSADEIADDAPVPP